MLELQGIAVSPGFAIGRAIVFDREGYSITRCLITKEEADGEWSRLGQAVEVAHQILGGRGEATRATWGAELGEIGRAHV